MKSRTADLFSPPSVPLSPSAPSPSAPMAPLSPLASVPPPARGAMPASGGGTAQAQRLWYAAVFPALTDTPQSLAELHRLALHAQQFTSFVSIELPNALLLEIKGSLKIFGSLERLHADIDAHWRRLAVPASSATAPSTLAALWCARAGSQVLIEDPATLPSRLRDLPIAATAWDAEHLQTLRAMGVTRLGELLRLPRDGLARRLGPGALLDLDMALGQRSAPRKVFVPRERFRERCDFETETLHAGYLEKALEPLIERCARFLRERQAGVQTLELKLRHRAGPATRVRIGLANITSERCRLTDVLTQKLTRLGLSAPVRGVELISGSLRALPGGSIDAFAGFGGKGGRDSVPQLVERLRARLGEDAVYGVRTIAEHRPEAACRRVHELPLASALRAAEAEDDGRMPRPVWLLSEPLLLSTGGTLRLHRSALILEHGPERIESGWWDGKGVARDYYTARQVHGARVWIFQERRSKRWYLHGVFA